MTQLMIESNPVISVTIDNDRCWESSVKNTIILFHGNVIAFRDKITINGTD